jgi:vanillate O-demethylase ferredoxin subunit
MTAARSRAWPPERLHREAFGASAQESSADRAFDVVLARSGRVIAVPAGVSIARALTGAGINVMVSCEQGVCGTCLTRVLEGEPEHRDSWLTAEEQQGQDQMLVCCSRARSERLTLDLCNYSAPHSARRQSPARCRTSPTSANSVTLKRMS